jgi:hypothetical protein
MTKQVSRPGLQHLLVPEKCPRVSYTEEQWGPHFSFSLQQQHEAGGLAELLKPTQCSPPPGERAEGHPRAEGGRAPQGSPRGNWEGGRLTIVKVAWETGALQESD